VERGARSGGRYGVCRIILVFGPASSGASGPKGSTGEEKLITQGTKFIFPGKIFLLEYLLVTTNMSPRLGDIKPLVKDQPSLHSHESGH
jgi:hypothetical protein